jgi:predicted nucleic acid-binding protein
MAAPPLLLDTNILLAYLRGKTLGRYIRANYPFDQGGFDSLVCVVSVGEIMSLSRKFAWGTDKVAEMQRLLDDLVTMDINSVPVLAAYAELDHYSETKGRKMGKNDVWIAAAARVSGATLLTTDPDFDHLYEAKLIQRILIDEKSGANR